MYPRTPLLVYLLLSPYSAAISWPRGKSREVQEIDASTYANIQEDEIASIIHGTESLRAYSRKPDCFRRAAGLIQTRCAELDMDEQERIRAAISMTICELGTASHSPPLECAMFSTNLRPAHTAANGDSHRSCVEALSRSAQYWSSYSGYLREVSQLCYAFRRWNDIDTARDIYRNATLEQLAFLEHVNAREAMLRKAEEHSRAILQDVLHGVADLRTAATDVHSDSQQLIRGMSAGLEQSTQALADAINALLTRAELNQMEALSRVNSAVDGTLQRHATSLDLVTTSLQQSLVRQIEEALLGVGQQFAEILSVADATHARLSVVDSDLGTIHQSVATVASSLSDLSVELGSNLAEVRRMHALQEGTAEAATQLSDTLAELTEAAHNGIQNITGTAQGLQHTMLGYDRLAWGKEVALWVCGVVLRVDPTNWERLAGIPAIRTVILVVRVVGWCIHAAASSSVSSLLLALSAWRWLARLFSARLGQGQDLEARRSSASMEKEPLPGDAAHIDWAVSQCDRRLASSSRVLSATGYPRNVSARRYRAQVSRIPDWLCNPPQHSA